GFRGFDAFGIKDLNFLAEYNTARPYTYAHFDPVSNYSNYGQPLAHPWGANFRELVGIVNYSYKRFDFSVQGTWGQYGTDPDSAAVARRRRAGGRGGGVGGDLYVRRVLRGGVAGWGGWAGCASRRGGETVRGGVLRHPFAPVVKLQQHYKSDGQYGNQ